VYIVEPTGPFEDDPNVTNKRFPGNPTMSYRSRHPLRIIAEVEDWVENSPEIINGMLERLKALREQGADLIED
jgi:rifampin ADP-ribosylating transferase